jgi:hypothetical protein
LTHAVSEGKIEEEEEAEADDLAHTVYGPKTLLFPYSDRHDMRQHRPLDDYRRQCPSPRMISNPAVNDRCTFLLRYLGVDTELGR